MAQRLSQLLGQRGLGRRNQLDVLVEAPRRHRAAPRQRLGRRAGGLWQQQRAVRARGSRRATLESSGGHRALTGRTKARRGVTGRGDARLLERGCRGEGRPLLVELGYRSSQRS